MVDWNCATSIQSRMEHIELGLCAIDDPTDPLSKELGAEWTRCLNRQGELLELRDAEDDQPEPDDLPF